jgi:hypothetical protein
MVLPQGGISMTGFGFFHSFARSVGKVLIDLAMRSQKFSTVRARDQGASTC